MVIRSNECVNHILLSANVTDGARVLALPSARYIRPIAKAQIRDCINVTILMVIIPGYGMNDTEVGSILTGSKEAISQSRGMPLFRKAAMISLSLTLSSSLFKNHI